MELIDLLKTVGLFEELTDEQLQRLAAIGKPMTFGKGAVIFRQGEAGDALYIVGSGEVEVLVGENLDRSHSQVYLGRGQIFGEMALIDGGPRSATTLCTRDGTQVYRIARETFNELCKADTAIGYVVMRNMAHDLSFKLRHHNLALL